MSETFDQARQGRVRVALLELIRPLAMERGLDVRSLLYFEQGGYERRDASARVAGFKVTLDDGSSLHLHVLAEQFDSLKEATLARVMAESFERSMRRR